MPTAKLSGEMLLWCRKKHRQRTQAVTDKINRASGDSAMSGVQRYPDAAGCWNISKTTSGFFVTIEYDSYDPPSDEQSAAIDHHIHQHSAP